MPDDVKDLGGASRRIIRYWVLLNGIESLKAYNPLKTVLQSKDTKNFEGVNLVSICKDLFPIRQAQQKISENRVRLQILIRQSPMYKTAKTIDEQEINTYPETCHCSPIILVQQITQVRNFGRLYAQFFNHITSYVLETGCSQTSTEGIKSII
nr:hypothetical protein Iba_chr05aCG5480 [Ipomoea batatas]